MENLYKTELEKIVEYYELTRQVGHSHAQIYGLKNADNPVILFSSKYSTGQQIKEKCNNQKIIIATNSDQLRGMHDPLVLEHHALNELLENHTREYKKRINDLTIALAKANQKENISSIKRYESVLDLPKDTTFHNYGAFVIKEIKKFLRNWQENNKTIPLKLKIIIGINIVDYISTSSLVWIYNGKKYVSILDLNILTETDWSVNPNYISLIISN